MLVQRAERFCVAPLGKSASGCPSFGGQRTVGVVRSKGWLCQFSYRALQQISRPEASLKQQRFIKAKAPHFRRPKLRLRFIGSLLQSAFLASALHTRGAVLFASRATQRKMRAGFGVSCPRSNPSIEATNTGGQRLRAFANAVPPVFAPHLQR